MNSILFEERPIRAVRSALDGALNLSFVWFVAYPEVINGRCISTGEADLSQNLRPGMLVMIPFEKSLSSPPTQSFSATASACMYLIRENLPPEPALNFFCGQRTLGAQAPVGPTAGGRVPQVSIQTWEIQNSISLPNSTAGLPAGCSEGLPALRNSDQNILKTAVKL
jgi:hypothetical protein